MEKVTEKNVPQTKRQLSIPRHTAVKILNRIDRSESYSDKLIMSFIENTEMIPADRALMTEIVNGVIRWRNKLDWVLTGFYHGEFGKCLNLVKNALRVGLYQMMFLNKIPPHAAINESVEIVKHIQGEKAAGLANAVLRNISRNLNNIRYPRADDDKSHYLSVLYSHPKWMVKRYVQRFGESEAIELMAANNSTPHLVIRINRGKTSADEIKEIFDTNKVNFEQSELLADSIMLKKFNGNIAKTEIFRQGKVTVQDTAASLVCLLAAPAEGSFVIDMCAAPGGKATYLADLMNNKGKVLALDKFEAKCRMIKDNAARLGNDIIETMLADSKEFVSKTQADMVLVDAPCSGTGTLRKKPEIKWRLEREDIDMLTKLQRALLSNAVQNVKQGGCLVYSTCSLEEEENEKMAGWFLETHKDFELDPAENYLPAALCKDGYLYAMPHKTATDGAFAAKFRRKEA